MIVFSRSMRKTARQRLTVMVASLSPEGYSCYRYLDGISSVSASLPMVSVSSASCFYFASPRELDGLGKCPWQIFALTDASQ